MIENYEELKLKIEAILFSYADWTNITEITKILNLDSENTATSILEDLKKKYEKEEFSFQIINEDKLWRMKIKDKYENIIGDFIKNTEIPKQVLKVLAIIAYEQPVTKTRLNEIIGRGVLKEISYLFKNGFISAKKKGIGRYYSVTKKFKDYFEIDNLEQFYQTRKKKELEKNQDKNQDKNLNNFKKENEENEETQENTELKEELKSELKTKSKNQIQKPIIEVLEEKNEEEQKVEQNQEQEN